MRDDHKAYVEEAEKLTATATTAADAAEQTRSKVALRGAIVALQDAAAMHQRATWSAPKGSDVARHHHAETARLNERVSAMRRIMPQKP